MRPAAGGKMKKAASGVVAASSGRVTEEMCDDEMVHLMVEEDTKKERPRGAHGGGSGDGDATKMTSAAGCSGGTSGGAVVAAGPTLYQNLMFGLEQNPNNWFALMDSLVEIHYECDVHPNTLHLAATVACIFLAKQTFLDVSVIANLRLVSCLALFSSAKFEDGYSLKISKFLNHIGSGYKEDIFLRFVS